VSVRGPVFCQPICDALGDISVIDLAVVYPVGTEGHDVAIPLMPSYRPLSTTLREPGLPAPGETTWYHDLTDGHYRLSATSHDA
jgi:putative long chain acyl-CoA synthase